MRTVPAVCNVIARIGLCWGQHTRSSTYLHQGNLQ